MLDPLIATAATKVPSPGLLENWFSSIAFTPKIIISAICVDAHWTPLVWTWTEECLTANSWDLPGMFPSIRHLNDCLAKAVGARTYTHRLSAPYGWAAFWMWCFVLLDTLSTFWLVACCQHPGKTLNTCPNEVRSFSLTMPGTPFICHDPGVGERLGHAGTTTPHRFVETTWCAG